MTIPRHSVEVIAAASAAPVYGPLDTYLGAGVVGGYVAPYEEQTKDAGGIVVSLLNGVAPADITPGSIANVPMVDWRQLRRWDIDERLLPPDTVVRFREPTSWEKYWREISLGIAVLLLQAVLIAALLFERRTRRRTASALKEAQEQMSLAARAAGLSLWVWDAARDKIMATTHSWRHADPRQQEPIAFKDVLAAAHPADRADLQRAAEEALATGSELDVEYRLAEPRGGVRWIAARGRAELGKDRQLFGVALDVTERKSAELRAAQDRAALRHMTRVSMMGQLSAAIAHQLNQPLAAILGNAEAAQKMLGRANVDLDELRAICSDIVSEDQRAAETIRRLSALYKRGDIKTEPLYLNALIRETLDLLRTELLTRQVTPVAVLVPELPLVEGEHVQLQQVLLNLVLNAADALAGIDAAKRRLEIRTRYDAATVQLLVIDNGPGIRPEELERVFEPFWSTKEGGTGNGPRDLPVDPERASWQHCGHEQRGRRHHVLREHSCEARAVSDGRDARDDLHRRRRPGGPHARWRACCAQRTGMSRHSTRPRHSSRVTTGKRKAASCSTSPCRGSTGSSCSAAWPSAGRDLPIVFVTGHGDIPMSVKAIKAGATDFLTKPVDARTLVAAVRAAIAQGAATRQERAETGGAPAAAREPDCPRARGARRPGGGQAQQADRGGSRRGRADRQVPSRTHHGANAGEDRRGADAHRGATRGRLRSAVRAQALDPAARRNRADRLRVTNPKASYRPARRDVTFAA